jgi:uncharacterized protein (TIRG00374 family)
VLAFADWRSVGAVLKTVHLHWVLAGFGLLLLDRVILNSKWQVLLAARHVGVGFWKLLRIQLAANFLGSFLPSTIGVDFVRIAALVRGGHPSGEVIGATLIDRASMVLGTFLFASATILVLSQVAIPPEMSRIVLILTGIGFLVCATALLPGVRRWVRLSLLPRLPEKVKGAIHSVADAALAFRHEWRALLWAAVTTAVTLVLRILFAKCVALSCGVDVRFLDLLLVIPMLWIIVMIPITIGNIGVQDAGYVAVMALIGVGPAVAVSMSIIEHVVARAVSLPGALFIGDVTARGESANAAVSANAPRS